MSGITLVIIVMLIMFVAVVIVLSQDEEPDEIVEAAGYSVEEDEILLLTDHALDEVPPVEDFIADGATSPDLVRVRPDVDEPAVVELASPDEAALTRASAESPNEELGSPSPPEPELIAGKTGDSPDPAESEPATPRSDD